MRYDACVMDRGGVRMRALVVLVACSCSVGDGSENASSFGSNTAPVTVSTTTPMSNSGSDTDDDDSSGSGEGDASSGSEAGTTGEGTTSGSSGAPATTDGSTGMTTAVATGGEQPDDGMYSPCMMAAECVGLTYCATVMDAMGGMAGYCTALCADPTSDCNPTPGGTAVPICFPFGEGGTEPNLCALDCSAGQVCPAPMICYPLETGSICA